MAGLGWDASVIRWDDRGAAAMAKKSTTNLPWWSLRVGIGNPFWLFVAKRGCGRSIPGCRWRTPWQKLNLQKPLELEATIGLGDAPGAGRSG